MNSNKNNEHRTTNNTDIHKTTQIYFMQFIYSQHKPAVLWIPAAFFPDVMWPVSEAEYS
jgi:hypothetical protein